VITIAFASGGGLKKRFRLYTNDSFNGDSFCQDESMCVPCLSARSDAAFKGEVDWYLPGGLMEPFAYLKSHAPFFKMVAGGRLMSHKHSRLWKSGW
jgi:hypothetical protein